MTKDAEFIVPSIYVPRDQLGHLGFLIVLAFRSFQLSGPSSCPVILAILLSFQKIKKEKRLLTFYLDL
jgi:hypothetical protein